MNIEAFVKKCTFYTVEEISTPKDNTECHCNKWWALSSEGKVIIWDKYRPQCNSNKDIATMISKKLYSGDVVLIPVAYTDIDNRSE